MFDFIMDFSKSLVFSLVLSLAMGFVYFFVSAVIVDVFGLNRGARPVGLWFFNCALTMTVVTFFVLFAFSMRN